jgi:tetratricopeptide (TPR) repeat protein
MNQNVRLQNLRDFTVQIRNAADKTVGTGIAVSTDGKIVTCAHVVESALGAHPREVNGAEVGIYFPQVRGGEDKKYGAKIDCCFPSHDDDMVLLQIIGEKSPLAPEQIAVLGMADQSEGNPFRTYGYSPIGNYPATRGDGIIQGSVEAPADRNLQVDPIQLKSRDIAAGMSGAAVLDVTRNLVVGLVMERFYSNHAVQDDIGYGVDSKVLTFDPFDFVLRGEALELKPAPELRLDKDLFQQAIEIVNYVRAHRKPEDRFSWNAAPSVLDEWTGRDDLLAQITEDWNNPQKHVTGLIGFGGEGKSSLARKWVETIIGSKVEGQKSPDLQPSTFDGIFWWGFYENRSVDEFLESALKFLGVEPRKYPSSNQKAQVIGALLSTGRYLFVLDGLEVLQHQEGDQYGLLTSNDLRNLLTYFARPDNQSFCLITSRAPLLDLMDYTTYTHRDVERLSEADGIALLERLQVKGSKSQLGKVVADWDGHALTISLLGSYLAEKYNGDIAHLADIPIPTADEPRYERVHRVLRRYDEHLTESEREFLKLFSAFRTPVHESAFEKVFAPLLKLTAEAQSPQSFSKKILRALGVSAVKKETGGSPLRDIVNRLVTYRILHCDTTTQTYTAHPLVRNHYLAHLTHDTGSPETHLKIKDYYLSIAGYTLQYPTLDDLNPLIEAVHHACEAGTYDEAEKILRKRIDQENQNVMLYQLGAHETMLGIIIEFFPHGDLTKDPSLSLPESKRFLLNRVGFCLMNLGRLSDAVPFFERNVKENIEAQDWDNASDVYQNLASLYIYLGELETSAKAAQQALDLARRAQNKRYEYVSLTNQAWALHLKGDLPATSIAFNKAEKLIKELFSRRRYLFSLSGIRHADHLRRRNKPYYARSVTISNMILCEQDHWTFLLSQCHRVLGDLDSDLGNGQSSAYTHYDLALKIARSISHRQTLIEALLARGRFFARGSKGFERARFYDLIVIFKKIFPPKEPKVFEQRLDVGQAFTDLNEALNYAVEGGYRIYEADIRVALGWAYLANGEKEKATQSAQRALQMSQEMGYHWGKVDAEEVLSVIARA